MALSSHILKLLFGRPLATSEERAEYIGPSPEFRSLA
jgi:hypothetical protein